MTDQEVSIDGQVRFDPQTRRLMVVDHTGEPLPTAQRKAFIARMTPDELRALVEALFDLPIS